MLSIKKKIGCGNLINNLQNHLKAIPNKNYLQNIIEYNPNYNQWCVGIVSMHAPIKKDGTHGDSWYAMISKNKLNEYHCLYKDLINKFRIDKNGNKQPLIVYYFPFNTEKESINFLNYIQTDFVQCCLSFIKTGAHFDRGELKYIPWQDFTQEWNDYKLFKKYNITKEEIKHIYDILPNYYNIERLNLEKY